MCKPIILRFGWTGGAGQKGRGGSNSTALALLLFREDFYYAAAPPNVRLKREHCFLDPKGFLSCEQF